MLILVTGATGYLGAHIVLQALDAGYTVRITTRPGKLEKANAQFGGKVEVVSVADIAEGDYKDALTGVDAVIHVASPVPSHTNSADDMFKGAVEGDLNILRQATAAGIKRFVLTSTRSAVADLRKPELMYTDSILNENDWNPMTLEAARAPGTNNVWVYGAAKTLAEREVWKFAEEHPEIDVTTINPPFLLGPIPLGFKPTNKEALETYSSLGVFYKQVLQEEHGSRALSHPQNPGPLVVDVRDAARAHLLALTAPLSIEPGVGRKRMLVAGPQYMWRDAIEHLRVSFPELAERGRLVDIGTGKNLKDLKTMKFDTSRAREILGLTELIPWEKTVDDMVASILKAESELEE